MSNIFTRTVTIPDNSSDIFGRCKPGALQDIMQETGNMHSEVLGLARDDLPGSVVWVLAKALLRLSRPVERGDELTVSTWYRGNVGALVYRDNDMHMGGEHIAEAVTAWVMFDLERQRPIRPDIAEAAKLVYTPPTPKTILLGKAERPARVCGAGTRPVWYSDLDMNGHMNNIKYMDILCDAIKLEEHPKAFLKSANLHYTGQTMPGQSITLEKGGLPDGRIYISGAADGKRVFEAAAELGAL